MDNNKSNWLKTIKNDQYIFRSDTVAKAYENLNSSAKGILLLIDSSGMLIRTVTDGDLRRLLLSGSSINDTLSLLTNQEPVVAGTEDSASDILTKMNRFQISQIPILSDEKKPIGIVYRQHIDNKILLSTPHMGDMEKTYVSKAFSTNWVAPIGPNLDAFEIELANKMQVRYAVAVSSGTAAIHLALKVLGVEANDIVFCSSFTFIASANPIIYLGAKPVFIDSDEDTWNMSPSALKRAFLDAESKGKLPKAVVVVNLYGQSANYQKICEICDHYQVAIVEDAAESLGATYNDRYSGTIGRIGIYSFNGNKIITTSGGGMLVTNEKELADKAKFLSTQAREPVPWYEHKEVGYNYRMSNILAGVGLGQLKVLDKRVEARRNVFERYVELLSNSPEIKWMPEANFGQSTRWLSTAQIDLPGINILLITKILLSHGIECRQVWKPLHLQPIFKKYKYFTHAKNGNSICDNLFKNGICLPSSSHLTIEQQRRVADSLKSAIKP